MKNGPSDNFLGKLNIWKPSYSPSSLVRIIVFSLFAIFAWFLEKSDVNPKVFFQFPSKLSKFKFKNQVKLSDKGSRMRLVIFRWPEIFPNVDFFKLSENYEVLKSEPKWTRSFITWRIQVTLVRGIYHSSTNGIKLRNYKKTDSFLKVNDSFYKSVYLISSFLPFKFWVGFLNFLLKRLWVLLWKAFFL